MGSVLSPNASVGPFRMCTLRRSSARRFAARRPGLTFVSAAAHLTTSLKRTPTVPVNLSSYSVT